MCDHTAVWSINWRRCRWHVISEPKRGNYWYDLHQWLHYYSLSSGRNRTKNNSFMQRCNGMYVRVTYGLYVSWHGGDFTQVCRASKSLLVRCNIYYLSLFIQLLYEVSPLDLGFIIPSKVNKNWRVQFKIRVYFDINWNIFPANKPCLLGASSAI